MFRIKTQTTIYTSGSLCILPLPVRIFSALLDPLNPSESLQTNPRHTHIPQTLNCDGPSLWDPYSPAGRSLDPLGSSLTNCLCENIGCNERQNKGVTRGHHAQAEEQVYTCFTLHTFPFLSWLVLTV